MLDDLRIERYARHILLREVGGVGQEKILSSTVRIDGLSEAGCWAATYLVLAGVGRLHLADPRPVPAGGLLPLLPAAEEGSPRDQVAVTALASLNPDVVSSVEPAGPEDREYELVRITVSGRDEDYVVATGNGRAVGGWTAVGSPCPRCIGDALRSAEGVAGSGPAPALAGSVAASEILAAILQPAARPTGLRIHRLGEASPLPACSHGGAA